MALSAVALANRALLKIGAAAIQGFHDASTEADLANAFYGPTRDALLSAYPWTFATTQVELNRLAEVPLADFANAFQLPDGTLRVLSAGAGGRSRGLVYRIAGRRLLSDAARVVASIVFRPEEGDTPPFFDAALIDRLAAELCIPLTESTSRAESLNRLAEDAARRARLVDAQQDTPQQIDDFVLLADRG